MLSRRGDRAVAAAGDLRLSDHAADAHRRGRRRDGEGRHAQGLRVHQRRERVRRAVGGHRLLRGRRAHLHGDVEPGPAVHGRGRLQRRRPRAADRDDHRQPRDRRADQHLERPLRQHVDARRGLDPAVRRDQPGGARPAHPGVPPRRGAVVPGDGVHGRLHPHPRVRPRRRADAGRGRRVPAAVRAAPGARPERAGDDGRDGRPRGVHRGPLPRAPQADARADAHPAAVRGIRKALRTGVRRTHPQLPHRGRRDRRRVAGLDQRHRAGGHRRPARRGHGDRLGVDLLVPSVPAGRAARRARRGQSSSRATR